MPATSRLPATVSLLPAIVFAFLPTLALGQQAQRPPEPVTRVYVMNLDGTGVQELFSVPDYPILGSPAWSPDGRLIALDGWKQGEGTSDARIFVWSAEDGSIQDLGPGAMPTFSPDGARFAFSSYDPRGVWTMKSDGSDRRRIDQAGWGAQWSRNGKWISYTRYNNGPDIILHNVADQTSRSLFEAGIVAYRQIYWNSSWSPTDDRICFKARTVDGDYEVGVISTKGFREGFDVPLRESVYGDFDWLPDGRSVLVIKRDPERKKAQIHRLELETRQLELLPTQPADRDNNGLSLSPDGKQLVFTSRGI